MSHKKKIRESEMKKRYEKQNQDLRQEIEELEDMSLQAADSGGGSGAADVSDRLRQEMLAREEEERAVERVRMEMLQEEYSLQEMRNQQAEEAAALEAKAAILEVCCMCECVSELSVFVFVCAHVYIYVCVCLCLRVSLSLPVSLSVDEIRVFTATSGGGAAGYECWFCVLFLIS